jgi:thiamine biosynthesis protein ThiI
MKEIILIKNGELALKGLNRRTFEDMLVKNMRRRLESIGKFKFTVAQSTIVAEPENESIDLDEAVERIGKVFGIAGFSRAAAVEKEMDVILKSAEEYLAPQLLTVRSFKVEAKRSDKKFPLT